MVLGFLVFVLVGFACLLVSVLVVRLAGCLVWFLFASVFWFGSVFGSALLILIQCRLRRAFDECFTVPPISLIISFLFHYFETFATVRRIDL